MFDPTVMPDGTYHANGTRFEPPSGYAVALPPDSAEWSPYIGVWTDPDGHRSIDHVVWIGPRDLAESLGRRYNQRAIWSFAEGKEIWL